MRNTQPFPLSQQPGIMTLTLPVGAELLTVTEYQGHPQLWAIVDWSNSSEVHNIYCLSGNWTLQDRLNLKHIASLPYGGTVLHYFVEVKAAP